MKLIEIIVLLLLLMTPCMAENASLLVENDTEWLKAVRSHTQIISADQKMFSSDETDSGQIAACEYIKLDTIIALNDSKNYNVSREYQKLKTYYESMFEEYYQYATNVSDGLNSRNVSKLERGKSHLLATERYRVLIETELDTLIEEKESELKKADSPYTTQKTATTYTSYNTETFDYLGANEKYAPVMERIYKDIALSKDVEFLEMGCFFWEDYVSLSIVVDSMDRDAAINAGIAAFYAYSQFYHDTRWPEKAEIYIKEPNGEHIYSGVVYSKWIEDYEAEAAINESAARDTVFNKFAHTIH